MAEYVSRDRRFDRLMKECAANGFCGGLRNGEPCHVRDYLPAVGEVTAEAFAELMIYAEGDTTPGRKRHGRTLQDLLSGKDDPEMRDTKWRALIEGLFLKHMGAAAADVSALKWTDDIERNWMDFRVDDLSSGEVQALVMRHLSGMHENSPPESVHAFDLSKLKQPSVTFWSAWLEGKLVAMGALKKLDDANGEIKSMRVADAFLGRGAGRAMLEHILREARGMGLKTLWLETGSTEAFAPAIKLYESAGFVMCGPFGGYTDDPFSRFMTRAV